MEAFLPIGVLLIMSLVTCTAIFALTHLLGPRHTPATVLSTYECGVKPEGNARQPFKNRFYLIAVLFLLFDVEAAFFFPWALVYRDSLREGAGLLVAMLIYMAFMVLGLFYIYRKQALELK